MLKPVFIALFLTALTTAHAAPDPRVELAKRKVLAARAALADAQVTLAAARAAVAREKVSK